MGISLKFKRRDGQADSVQAHAETERSDQLVLQEMVKTNLANLESLNRLGRWVICVHSITGFKDH